MNTEVKTIGDFKINVRVDSNDEIVATDNLIKHPYEKFWSIESGERWVDIGGHHGSFAIRALSMGAKVHSFEPFPDSLSLYRKNLKLNGFKPSSSQYAVMQDCLSSVIELNLGSYRGKDNFGANTVFKTRWKTERPKITVPCISFDKAMEIGIESLGTEGNLCLKIDAEGVEIQILENFNRTDISKIALEYHFINTDGKDDAKSLKRLRNICKRLEGLGYRVQPEEKIPSGDLWMNPRKPNIMLYISKI